MTPQPPAGTRYVHGPANATDVSVTNMAATFTATVAGTYQVAVPAAGLLSRLHDHLSNSCGVGFELTFRARVSVSHWSFPKS